MKVPFTNLDGFRPRPEHYADYIQEGLDQLQVRTLSRIVHFGVAEGLDVSSATTALVTGVTVSSGLAYDYFGRRVYMESPAFLGLDGGDVDKYVCATRTQTSGLAEKHPITGVTAYTRVVDSAEVSAIANPDETLGHVRLALIQSVSPFPTDVGLRAASQIDRDVLLVSAPFPYVTVGPVGSASDFEGDDEQPFIDAVDGLSATSGGVIYVKNAVYSMTTGVDIDGAALGGE